MPRKGPSRKKASLQPGAEFKPNYNEPEISPKKDRMPSGNVIVNAGKSRAELRIAVEHLLRRPEPPSVEVWAPLGEDAKQLLIQMLNEPFVARVELRRRILATLGQLDVREALPDIREILLSSSEDRITRAQAASALGRMKNAQAIPILGQAIVDKDPTVRRQVALGLARHPEKDVIPHLLQLINDPSPAVSEAATAVLADRKKKGPKKPAQKKRRYN